MIRLAIYNIQTGQVLRFCMVNAYAIANQAGAGEEAYILEDWEAEDENARRYAVLGGKLTALSVIDPQPTGSPSSLATKIAALEARISTLEKVSVA